MTDTTSIAKSSKPRKVRTQAERAQDLLDAANARHNRAKTAAKRLDAELQDVQKRSNDANAEVQAAAAAVRYAAQHPDLPSTKAVSEIQIGGTS